MIKSSRIWIYSLALLSMILILTNSCTKSLTNITAPATVTDIDGNVYHTVKIGTQVWMLENLRTTKYRNGKPIPNVTDTTSWKALTTGAYCSYNNDNNNTAVYGLLYNWQAMVSLDLKDSIAPKGWHVPTQVEWNTLANYLGDLNVDGGKLKETGTTHWQSPNTGATNEKGFTALPGGQRASHGQFSGIGTLGTWWTSTGDGTFDAWGRYINYNDSTLYRYDDTKKAGFSVRCVMDITSTSSGY